MMKMPFEYRTTVWLCTALLATTLVGCGGGGAGGGGSTTPTTPSAATISISSDKTSLKSDGVEEASLTLNALNASNAAVPGVVMNLTSSSGILSASQVTTDATGSATVTLKSGTVDRSNRTITVTATANGATDVQIPLQIVGSTTEITTNTTSLTAGGVGATMMVTVKHAGGLPVFNVPVGFSQSGTGSVTVTPSSGSTNVNGQLTVTVTGVTAGTATLTASALNATASSTFNIIGAAGQFSIKAPDTADPASLTTAIGSTLGFTITAPAPTQSVRFATTVGTWQNGSSVYTANVSGGEATASLSSSVAGIANIQVDGFSGLAGSGTQTGSDTHTVAITSQTATQIALQATVSVVAPSVGGSTNTTTLKATVKDGANQPVGNAPVLFTLINPTGGGEFISPVVVLSSDGVNSTNPLGEARATFTSGSLPTGAGGVTVQSSVVGAAPAITSTTPIVIGGTAGSIAIGEGNKITIVNATTYAYPLSVLVADAAGNPVKNTQVSLKAWPVSFSTGTWAKTTQCHPGVYDDGIIGSSGLGDAYDGGITADILNEDVDEDAILDTGEDRAYSCADNTGNPFLSTSNRVFSPYCSVGNVWTLPKDNVLTPGNSTGGNVLGPVTTDENGLANFNLNFLKAYANWVKVRVRATALVQGTETTSQIVFRLPVEKDEATNCNVTNSPFGN